MANTRSYLNVVALFCGLLLVTTSANGFEEVDISDWKDPIDRDESIENTSVSTVVNKIDESLFEYVYRIESGSENKGRIASFWIDLSCNLNFDEVDLPPVSNPKINRDRSSDGQHVPAVLFGAPQMASPMGISVSNQAAWALSIEPRHVAEGFRLISPAPPGLRPFRIDVSMDTWGWRYDLYEEDDPRIKWIPDFRVTGEVIGPACKLDDDPEIAFLGAAEEPFGVNKFLAYAEPIRGNVEVAPSGSFELVIFYDENIEASSFKARLNGKDISALFSPSPGSFEKVVVDGPWKKNHNRLRLSALGTTDEKDRGNEKFKSIDNDVFEIDVFEIDVK